ncbi:hypothetical protein BDW60DRAFT_53159 [Aspergillus nidulans var. acristatus]
MVFLRLTVKVYPREQTQPSNSFSFRSLLGDRERDDDNRTSSSTAAGKPASFLIVLENPEDVTLGGLAGMIRAKWRKLRPGVEPLSIKKLLDDDHEADDLDTDMTVADVFVDKGKARSDGHDQRRTVRVIQKPAGGGESPVRFPSVAQDWDAAAEHYEILRQKKQKQEAESAVKKLGAITEESGRGFASPSPFVTGNWADYTPNRIHRRDIPVSSVEKDVEIPGSPLQSSQPIAKSLTRGISQDLNGEGLSAAQGHRAGSEELGDSPRSPRATTPRKKSTPRRTSVHSQASTDRSDAGDSLAVDSPALQLTREHAHSVSPQKRPALEATKPDAVTSAEETESESNSESDSDDGSETSDSDRESQDKDGDTAMREATPKQKPESPIAAKKTDEATTAAPAVTGSQSRKRKNSADQLSPNKEPRLDRTTPPVNSERRGSEASAGSPRFSPSGRRLGGTTAFTGTARRLSFTDRISEPPSKGLGLGITKSPSKKPSAVDNLSQESTQSTGDVPQSTPIPTSSAPTIRRGSVSQNVSTPTDLHTPVDKAKNLHSALRKDSLTSSARRSVSFAESDDVLVADSQPAPTSTPIIATKPSTSTPASQPTTSEKRRSSLSMVFPPGVSMERIAQYEREAEEKVERQKKERAEFEEKIKAAEKDNANPEYLKKLKAAFKTWQSLVSSRSSQRKGIADRLEKLQAELKKMEESSTNVSSQGKGKKSQASKPARSQQASKNDTPASKAVTSTPATNGDRKTSVTHSSGWNAINNKSPSSDQKSATQTTNGTNPKSATNAASKEPVARTVATRTLSKPFQPASTQSRNSTASEELDLPAMKVQARTTANATKKVAPQKPVEVSFSSEEETSEEESSSEESSSSDSESESASEGEARTNNPVSSVEYSTVSAPQKPKSTPPSAQRTLNSSAPPAQTTQSQSQAQLQSSDWRWPRSSQTGITRLSLKSIKGEVASQAQAQAAAKASATGKPGANAQPRRGVFSPPDSDSEETESESESESESERSSSSESEDGTDSDSDKGKLKKRSPSPPSVADAGDIMSSGHIRKLRTARTGGRT